MKNVLLIVFLLFSFTSIGQGIKGLKLGSYYGNMNETSIIRTTVGGVQGTLSGSLKNKKINSLLFMSSKDVSYYNAQQFIKGLQLKYDIKLKEISNGANNQRLEANKNGVNYGLVCGSFDNVNYSILFTMEYAKDVINHREKEMKELINDF